jgi:hypothetical protein
MHDVKPDLYPTLICEMVLELGKVVAVVEEMDKRTSSD